MKIAIPLFNERISPHFGASGKILLIDIEDETVYREAIWDVGNKSAMAIARLLVELGVEKVICGGIQYYYKEWLISKGIGVMYNQKGLAKDIIQNFPRFREAEQNETEGH